MNNLGRRLVDRECGEYQRLVTESCNNQPCPKWSVSEWSEVGTLFSTAQRQDLRPVLTNKMVYFCYLNVSFSVMAKYWLTEFCTFLSAPTSAW